MYQQTLQPGPVFRPPKFNPFTSLVEKISNGVEAIASLLKKEEEVSITQSISHTTKTVNVAVKTTPVHRSAVKVTAAPTITCNLVTSLEELCKKDTISKYEISIIESNPDFLSLITSSSIFRPLYYSAIYKSVPDDISHEVWRYIKEMSPFKGDNGVNGRSVEYEDILRKYTKKASNKAFFAIDFTASAGGFLVNLTNFLKDKASKLSWGDLKEMLPDFHVQAAALVIIWTKMLYDLSRCKNLNWSSKQVANLATTIVIASLQLLVRECPYTKPVVSVVRTSYGIYADIMSNMPEDIKRQCPDIIKNTTPTWHKEIAEAMHVSNIAYSQALNMLYTFRVGDNYVRQIKSGMDKNTIVRTLTALSPFPVDGEEVRLVKLHQHKSIY